MWPSISVAVVREAVCNKSRSACLPPMLHPISRTISVCLQVPNSQWACPGQGEQVFISDFASFSICCILFCSLYYYAKPCKAQVRILQSLRSSLHLLHSDIVHHFPCYYFNSVVALGNCPSPILILWAACTYTPL